VVVYEPAMTQNDFFGSPVVRDLSAFKTQVDLIVANRLTPELEDVKARVYSRDLFGQD
jgi:UDPglucose 6-dehydrogenase